MTRIISRVPRMLSITMVRYITRIWPLSQPLCRIHSLQCQSEEVLIHYIFFHLSQPIDIPVCIHEPPFQEVGSGCRKPNSVASRKFGCKPRLDCGKNKINNSCATAHINQGGTFLSRMFDECKHDYYASVYVDFKVRPYLTK